MKAPIEIHLSTEDFNNLTPEQLIDAARVQFTIAEEYKRLGCFLLQTAGACEELSDGTDPLDPELRAAIKGLTLADIQAMQRKFDVYSKQLGEEIARLSPPHLPGRGNPFGNN